MTRKIPKKMLDRVSLVTGKRARLVVEHLLKHGSITTEDLENYGYKHPPRAVRDVREQGIPLDMFWTQAKGGRRIAGYRFGDPDGIRQDRLDGRKVISKDFARKVIAQHASRCAICQTVFEERCFQIDHRIPYEVAGDEDPANRDADKYMPLCGSCNRAKSWSCEHCENWRHTKVAETCAACYWASPDSYRHVALRQIRRLDLVWETAEVKDFEALLADAKRRGEIMPRYVKEVLRKHLKRLSFS